MPVLRSSEAETLPLSTSYNYRADIDGLRALAIIPVIGFHAGWSAFGGGFVGVDVFFVISGFLISSMLLDELQESGRINVVKFYAKRARRLFPALALVMLATLLLGSLFLLPFGEQQDLAKSSLATSLFVSNIFFWMQSGYFDGPSELKPLLNMWSLSVEEQFYWVWPFLLVGLWQCARKFGVVAHQRRTVVMKALVVIAAASFGSCVWLTFKSQPTAFYMMPARSWEFALGGLVIFAPPLSDLRSRQWLPSVLGLAGMGMIVMPVVTLSYATPFPGVAAAIPALGTALLIYSGASEGSLTRRLLSMRAFVTFGLLSYSWYLWHWPLLAISRAYTYGSHDLVRDSFLVAAALLLSLLTYRFVENPIRHSKSGIFSTTRGALVSGMGLLIVVIACSLALGIYAKFIATSSGQQAALLAAMEDSVELTPECSKGEGITRFSGVLSAAKKCTIGDKEHPKRVLLWGDSFAGHYAPLLDRIGRKGGFAVLQRQWDGCAPLLGVMQWHGRIAQRDCAEFNPQVAAELKALRVNGVDTVVLAAHWLQQFPAVGGVDQSGQDVLVKFETGLRQTLDELGRLDFNVLLVAQTPLLPINVPRCLGRRSAEACGVSRATFEEMRVNVSRVMRALVENRPNMRIFDPAQLLCDPINCSVIIGNTIVYRDSAHLTASVLPLLEPEWALQLQGFLHGDVVR